MQERMIRIVITKDEDMFVAQCLEHDICVQAADMASLQVRFEDALAIEIDNGNLDQIPPAPEVFHKLWNEGLTLESRLENAELRLAA